MTGVHALAGAYVLDAVSDLERATFARHLAGCDTCALEVAELRETVARLIDATWTAPPPALRTAVLAEIARTPQVRSGRVRSGRPARAVGAGWRRWTAAAAAAGALAAGAGTAGWVVQEQRLRNERDRTVAAEALTDRIEAVLMAPDASVRRDPATGAGTVVVVVGSRRQGAAVVLGDLPALPRDQAYQLWVGDDGALVSAGVLPPGQSHARVLVTGLGDAGQIAVSREPAGGSPTGQPTGPIVADVDLG